MPATDQCHEQVKRALQNDGWTIRREQYRVAIPSRTTVIDIEAERGANGTKEQVIFIEVKCFPDEDSTTQELYTAIGQYLVYRAMIKHSGLAHTIYLAVPSHLFNIVFDTAAMTVVKESKIMMIVVDLEKEKVTQWIK